MYKYFISFIKQHKVLALLIILAVILLLFLIIVFALKIKSNYIVPQCQELLVSLLFFIVINILILYFIPKPKMSTNIFIQIIILYLVWIFLPAFKINTQFINYRNFRQSLNNRNEEDFVHFPEKIPDNAQNIKVCHHLSWQGDEDIMLKFDMSKEYIDKEIKKYKYEKTEYGKSKNPYDLEINPLLCENGNYDDYMTYVIKIKHKPLRYYGIAIKGTTIVYFYTFW